MSIDIIAMLVMGVFNLLGILIVGYGLRDVYRAWQTCSWEKTSGRLVEASLEETACTNAKSHRCIYEVKTTYAYDVSGRPFQGKTIAPSYLPTSEQVHHEKLLNTLKSVPSLNVYYDPLRPEKCTLVPGMDGGTFALLTIGIMWLAVTVGITGMIYLIQGGDLDLIQSISMG